MSSELGDVSGLSIKDAPKEEECLFCRGKGMPTGCPKCGKQSGMRPQSVEITDEIIFNHAIPDQYKDVYWNESIIRSDYQGLADNRGFQAYLAKLAKVYDIFAKGGIPKQSLLVMAPRRFGKVTWAYSCMKQAIAHGYSVAPLLDNTQYQRLNVLCSERPNSRYIKKLGCQIEDVDFADVVFLTVDKANWAGAFRTLDSLIDKRTRIGKPTFIISRFSMIEMTRSDPFDNVAAGFIDTARRENLVKYPSIIECSAKPHR